MHKEIYLKGTTAISDPYDADSDEDDPHYKILTLFPLDAICITTNCVVIEVCFATFVQKSGNRGTVLPQK